MLLARDRRASFPLLLAALGAAPLAQSRKLNGPLAQPGAADVEADYALSADGARVVFRSDVALDGVIELWGAPADASAPAARLHPPLAGGADVHSFALGANGRAVYVADDEVDGQQRLLVVPIAGGAPPLDLSGALVAGGGVLSVQLTPDGSRAVFVADKLVDGREELFSVPTDASAPAQSIGPVVGAIVGPIASYWISPDGARALYARGLARERLYSAPTDGGSPPVLLADIPPLYGSLAIVDLRFTADGLGAVFTAHDVSDDVIFSAGHYEVPLAGGRAPLLLNDGVSLSCVLGADGRVVYHEDGDLFSRRLDRTGRVQLDPAGWTVDLYNAVYDVTPDGATVVFSARSGGQALWRAPIAGGAAAVQLLQGGSLSRLRISAERVLCADQIAFTRLLSVPLAGGTPAVVLNEPLASGQHVGDFRFAAGGAEVVFVGAKETPGIFELFAAPADASAPARRIGTRMTGARDVASFLVAPDGEHVAYLAEEDFDATLELVATTLHGPGPTSYLDMPGGPVVGDVTGFRVAPGGTRVAYVADELTDERFTLHGAPLGGRPGTYTIVSVGDVQPEVAFTPSGERVVWRSTGDEILCSPNAANPPFVTLDNDCEGPFGVTADGARAVYRRDGGFATTGFDLRSAPVDDSQPPVRLHPLLPRNASVDAFALHPSAPLVVYRADQRLVGVRELFSAPAAGGAPPVQLHPQISGARDVGAFELTSDGSRVVFVLDLTTDVDELFVAPADGSRPARRLQPHALPFEDVTHFALAPDGRSVVWRSDHAADSRFDLFAAPLEGATLAPRLRGEPPPPVPLTTLAGTQAVEPDFRVGPDSRAVFFRLATDDPLAPELYRVPIDGGAPPQRLNPPLGDGGSVHAFAPTLDKARVVYLASKRPDDAPGLFSVPATGGPAVELAPRPPFADLAGWQVAPDSRVVVYLSDAKVDGVYELFAVPADGSAPPERVNDLLPPGGNVEADFVALGGGRVVYRADQEQDEVYELFLGRATFGRPWR